MQPHAARKIHTVISLHQRGKAVLSDNEATLFAGKRRVVFLLLVFIMK